MIKSIIRRKRNKQRFLKKFYKLSDSSEYLIQAPSHKKNPYYNESTKIWFYHKKCGRYFKKAPHVFLNDGSNNNAHSRCTLCNEELREHNRAIDMHKAIHLYGHKGHSPSLISKKKFKHTIKHHNYMRFLKEFNKLYSSEYELKAPNHKKNEFRGMNKHIWIYHKKCGTYTYKTPYSIISKSKYNIPCKQCEQSHERELLPTKVGSL